MKREKVAEWVEENANIWAVNSKDELIDVITRFASENALNQAKVNNSRLEGVSKPLVGQKVVITNCDYWWITQNEFTAC